MNRAYCGIDFGTSNSTVAVGSDTGVHLIPLEGENLTLPSALFFEHLDKPTDPTRVSFGRAAVDAYITGEDGRLLRALKSILGTSLMQEQTRIGSRAMAFTDILGCFFRHLKERLEDETKSPVEEIVLGRPVRFVDDDEEADRAAEDTLRSIARAEGFAHIEFQFEPVAAALDYEQSAESEELVLILDIGGGTSDFSIVRVSPQLRDVQDRKDDILANSGVHIGGTDFDRLLSIARVMPELGFGSRTRDTGLQLPVFLFNDLATWSRIHSLYTHKTRTLLQQLFRQSESPDLVSRLLQVVTEQKGHALAMVVEQAKIALTTELETEIRLDEIIDSSNPKISRAAFDEVLGGSLDQLDGTIRQLLQDAGLPPSAINTIFITGGSSSIPALNHLFRSIFPGATVSRRDNFGSVGIGLALDARRRFGG